jgi:hypothetical protein
VSTLTIRPIKEVSDKDVALPEPEFLYACIFPNCGAKSLSENWAFVPELAWRGWRPNGPMIDGVNPLTSSEIAQHVRCLAHDFKHVLGREYNQRKGITKMFSVSQVNSLMQRWVSELKQAAERREERRQAAITKEEAAIAAKKERRQAKHLKPKVFGEAAPSQPKQKKDEKKNKKKAHQKQRGGQHQHPS